MLLTIFLRSIIVETKMRTLMTETTEMIIVGNRLRHRSLARSIVLKKHRKNKKPQVKIRL